MHRPRRAFIWITALAVLLHLFAMPLMSAGAQMPDTAGHCPKAQASQHGIAAHDGHAGHGGESAPQPAHHLGMPCCCAAGSAGLAAIPISASELQAPRRVQLSVLQLSTAPPLSPRYRWPSLNPRASPLV
ncbi:DUF2946 domain-containing protein [Pseudomonas sp. SST3]|uniref:DUF2946 domain-containing protein n=1 Tax=Pseudomonas sp. SST3 TaxID=2267882 RepID=UPI000E068CF2|nr:DUF2946 domain-containing protein [Pseudomonas sp. SST3]NKQ09939.1 DUF2946 domain-containing protein [Pseudomonas sp. SST3]